MSIVRNRSQSCHSQPQVVNRQRLCRAEVNILQELRELRTTDWLFESERQQRLSERSLHHIIARAGVEADLPMPVHPYMLRRTGLYYRAALLLQPLGLSLGECCLLWNYYATSIPLSPAQSTAYRAIAALQEEGFLLAIEQLKTFTGISAYENIIDYLRPRILAVPETARNS